MSLSTSESMLEAWRGRCDTMCYQPAARKKKQADFFAGCIAGAVAINPDYIPPPKIVFGIMSGEDLYLTMRGADLYLIK